MERLVNKEDLQDHFKADLIDEAMLHNLINEYTEAPHSWDELTALSYEELVNLLVGSQKVYIAEL